MADTSVNIRIKTIGQEKLERLQRTVKATDRAFDKLAESVSSKVESSFRKAGVAAEGFGRQVKFAMLKAEQQVGRLQRKLKGVGGALASAGAGIALQRSVSGGADLVQTQIRLKALSEEYGEFDRIQKISNQECRDI